MKLILFIFFFLPVYCSNAQDLTGMGMNSTDPRYPLSVKSNEATRPQLALAKAEGDSISICTKWVLDNVKTSGQVHAGDYNITWAVTRSEGWYDYVDHATQWQAPSADAVGHLWVFVQDATDGRIVSDLIIKANFLKDSTSLAESTPLPYAWMPLINGYGNNFLLSKDGNYTLQIKIQPPPFHRHDPYNGDRFTKYTIANIPLAFNKNNMEQGNLSDKMEQQVSLSAGTGNAFINTLHEMYKQATDGKDTIQGDYRIALADEYSEGYWFYGKNHKFMYLNANEQSSKTNAHIEVAVLDAKTNRFFHTTQVTATLYHGNTKIGSKMEHFMWHPWLYHYGDNWRIPKGGKDYHVHVHMEPPPYRRYGKIYGKQFTQPADADFYNIKINTGQK